MERQRPRQLWTNTLGKICHRVAQQKIAQAWAPDSLGHRRHRTFQAQKLWVAGSYARGALSSHDLDLIMEVKRLKGTIPFAHTVANHIYGRFPDVVLLIGTPEENDLGMPFPEARLLWSPDTPDWKQNLAAIEPDPNATRYPRPYDQLPLRKAQIKNTIGSMETLLHLINQQVLRSQWTPLGTIRPNPNAWPENAQQFHERALTRMSEKNKKLLPFLMEALVSLNLNDTWQNNYSGHNTIKAGGTLADIGFPFVDTAELDSLQYEALAIFPHITRRGPNGIWTITRGPEHPLTKKFQGCHAYVIKNKERQTYVWARTDYAYGDIYEIEIFPKKDDAINFIKEMFNEDPALQPDEIHGAGILSIIAATDTIQIIDSHDIRQYTITHNGTYFDREMETQSEKATPENLTPSLTRKEQPPKKPDGGETSKD